MVQWRSKLYIAVLAAFFLLVSSSHAFSPNTKRTNAAISLPIRTPRRPGFLDATIKLPMETPGRARVLNPNHTNPRTALFSAPPCTVLPFLGSCIAKIGRVRVAALFVTIALAAAASYRFRRRLFWPGVAADPSFKEPLPPAVLGCPLLGVNILAGSRRFGPEFKFRLCSRKVNDARVWLSYFLGRPFVVVSGAELVTAVNSMEFELTGSGSERAAKRREQGRPEKVRVFGTNNLMFEKDKDRHAFLRRLVGASMTPQALKGALPTIQKTAAGVVSGMLLGSNKNDQYIKMEDVCVDYTMDIVQNQLLGLKLKASEVAEFREKLKVWLQAMYSLVGNLNIPFIVRRSPPYKAKQYIVSKLEEKLDALIANGPDTSTLSNMVFAVDEESGSEKLSREQILENAQLLAIAGSETSAGTLTLAMLLLGLHPDKYHKLVQEQEEIIERHGSNLTQTILDKQCPYLDAVVKEALRIGAVTGGFPKTAKQTIIVNGTQIPKNWGIMTSYRLTHQLDPSTGGAMDPKTGFEPERWLHPDTTPAEWIPFGAGPRYCLGKNLAMLEMKIFLAELARRVASFELVHSKDQSIRWNPATMIPRSADGVLIYSLQENTAIKVQSSL